MCTGACGRAKGTALLIEAEAARTFSAATSAHCRIEGRETDLVQRPNMWQKSKVTRCSSSALRFASLTSTW